MRLVGGLLPPTSWQNLGVRVFTLPGLPTHESKTAKSGSKMYFSDVSPTRVTCPLHSGCQSGLGRYTVRSAQRISGSNWAGPVLRHLLTIVKLWSGEVTCGVRKHHSEVSKDNKQTKTGIKNRNSDMIIFSEIEKHNNINYKNHQSRNEYSTGR